MAHVDLARYQDEVIRRFSNPKIKDTVARVNADAPLNYLLDSIRDRLGTEARLDLLAVGLAAWMRRLRGFDEAGKGIAIHHPLADELRRRAGVGGSYPRPLFAVRTLFGDLGEDGVLVSDIISWLSKLCEIGVRKTIIQALANFDAPR